MRSFTTKIIVFIMLLTLSQSGFSQNWNLVWSDEFNGNSVGPDWTFETGAGGWGNNELEYYRQDNASVSGGNLVITAKRENYGGANYTSARMKTQGRKSWKYGKIEARIATPSFNGAWPAFWMLGDNIGSVGWPKCGEIDIMEHVNGGNADFGTIHWDNNGHQSYSNSTDVSSGITGFHTYTIIWTAQSIKWLVDGNQYAEANIANGINGTEEFQKNFFILFNFAVGGQWPGYNIDNNAFPNQMKVDYVRVYQDNGTPPPPVIPASTDVITAYNDCNFGGFSGGLTIGDYNLARLNSLGIPNDAISSLRITQGYQAILYQDDNFGGASTVINSDNNCLNTIWNDKVTSIRILANGVTNMQGSYTLQNRNSGLNMDVRGGESNTTNGAQIQQWNVVGTKNQIFDFTHLGDGLYKVIVKSSGKSLDVNSFSKANGALVQQYDYNATVNQQFIVVDAGGGYYKLIARHSGKVVEVAGASTALEAIVQQWDNNNQTCSQWKFNIPIPASTDVITAYNDCNYSGFSGGLTIGDYNLARLQSLGVNNDEISSLRITQGFQAILYQDDNFGGISTVINSDNACLNDIWNNKVSSIKILANGVTNLQGAYTLQNRNSGLNMDVRGGESNTTNGAQIQQWNVVGTKNQIFDFTHLGDGLYKVIARSSGKSLDVNSFSKANGALVQQFDYNATVNQQFIVVDAGSGYYKLIARHSGKVVEVAGASTALEAIVQQWDNNNQTCGQWKFNPPIGASTGLVTTYKDVNYTGFSGGFSVGDYNLAAIKALGVDDNSITSVKVTEGYKIILYFDDNFTGQSVEITADNGYVGNFNDQVTSLKVRTNGVTNVAGTYFLQNRNSGLNMDVNGISTADGANIMQGTPNNGANQQFKFTHLGDGTYQVLAMHSNKSIDVDAIKMNDGANVQQWTYLGSANQQFIVVATDLQGCYKLIAKHSGKVVEVAGASTANGANVQQWTNNNQTCGQWKFVTPVITPPVDGTGDGLTGNYFNGMNFETPVYSRKDASISFDWGNGSPNAAVNVDAFSARWTGQIQPKYSETYTFVMNSDNGRRVWINGQLVIDKWIDDWGTDYTGTISLTANQKYDIKIEYFENYGGANAKFEWYSTSQTREVVPTKQLYSNNLPTVSIVTPATTATFDSPASIVFTSSAADNGGSVAKVEYYNAATKIGESAAGTAYSVTWSNVAAGTYTVTARANDNLGGVTVSAPLTVNVNQGTTPLNQPPSVSLIAPSNGASYNAPANVTITANASDVDGTVAKVEFYNGTTKLGEDASAPYTYTWSNVAAGTYTITAKATDDKGLSTTSGSVSVTVKTIATDACSSVASYVENNGYAAGSKVKNAGRQYECKEWPYSGWCNGASWAYAPGAGAYWTDAWYDRGACGARVGEESSVEGNTEVTIAPNPATDYITIHLNTASVVSVYNNQGTEVLPSTPLESMGRLNISSLADGMYFVKIDTGANVITKMILKR